MSVKVLVGDSRAVLATLPAQSVHCVVTSPPYWGLRDYGIAGQIGLDSTYQEFVEQMVAVFREVRRVLRADGTLWLNLGDSYCSTAPGTKGDPIIQRGIFAGVSDRRAEASRKMRPQTPDGLKPKDLCGIPWRVAFALQADGWWLRQDIIWSKPNPMPESVTDRCTKAHEYLFMLSKSGRYYYDSEAIKEQGVMKPQARLTPRDFVNGKDAERSAHRRPNYRIRDDAEQENATRNKRSVWEVATQPFSEAHFATFPPKLIEPCIRAGTSSKGCCAKCKAPWVRKTESSTDTHRRGGYNIKSGRFLESASTKGRAGEVMTKTIGWEPSCNCKSKVIPCTVLDPFGGSGTTGMVCSKLERDAILIEISPKYAEMARRRVGQRFAEIWNVEDD